MKNRIIHFINGEKLELSNYEEKRIIVNDNISSQIYSNGKKEIGVILSNVLYIEEVSNK